MPDRTSWAIMGVKGISDLGENPFNKNLWKMPRTRPCLNEYATEYQSL